MFVGIVFIPTHLLTGVIAFEWHENTQQFLIRRKYRLQPGHSYSRNIDSRLEFIFHRMAQIFYAQQFLATNYIESKYLLWHTHTTCMACVQSRQHDTAYVRWTKFIWSIGLGFFSSTRIGQVTMIAIGKPMLSVFCLLKAIIQHTQTLHRLLSFNGKWNVIWYFRISYINNADSTLYILVAPQITPPILPFSRRRCRPTGQPGLELIQIFKLHRKAF